MINIEVKDKYCIVGDKIIPYKSICNISTILKTNGDTEIFINPTEKQSKKIYALYFYIYLLNGKTTEVNAINTNGLHIKVDNFDDYYKYTVLLKHLHSTILKHII